MTNRAASRAGHIFLSCGEASGDRYGAALIQALRERAPGLRFTALGGPAVAAAGAEVIEASGDVAVMGFAEVLGALPALWRVRRRLWNHLRDGGVDLCVPIDFPGFNLALARQAHKRGIPVFYLIPPQLWAWGSWRLRDLRRHVDRIGTILPFETDFYSRHGLSVLPLDHPLMDEYGSWAFEACLEARERRYADPEATLTLGLLPGSRRQEVDRLLPRFRVAARIVQARLAPRRVRCLVSAAPGLQLGPLLSLVESGDEISEAPLPRLLEQLDLALVCSGTASLECALAGVPHELAYVTSRFNYAVARRLVRLDRIGLANLILGEDMVREHLQGGAKPLPLANAVMSWVGQVEGRDQFTSQARRLRSLCGEAGIWDRAAVAILELLNSQSEEAPR
jgi:lipid-A-disaccharide synthase